MKNLGEEGKMDEKMKGMEVDGRIGEITKENLRKHTVIFEKQKKEIEWLINDFATTLRFHAKERNSLSFYRDIIRVQLSKAMGGK
ncbi:MAG TPA: hypothetical protein ENH82_02490 [bacterium]|nr:hypothetical protein [bacterium]